MSRQQRRTQVFLVGCARSGTTLLQSLLASHPDIFSFPESHFFPHLRPGRPWVRRTGLVSRRAGRRLDAVAATLQWAHSVRPKIPFARAYARAFIDLLDAAARRAGKTGWIEKTPHHLHYIDDIQRLVPDASFIHIVRAGPDVVASLYAASHDPAFVGFSQPLSLDACIARWTTDVEITQRYMSLPNHFTLTYEELVADPPATLRLLCEFLGVQFTSRMVADREQTASQVILEWESWKSGARQPIHNANGTRVYEILDPVQREYLIARTAPVAIPCRRPPTP